jgi:hypothetical protein
MKKKVIKLMFCCLFCLVLLNCGNGKSYINGCYASNGCHDAFASCYVTFVLVFPDINQLNSFCAYRVYSCQQFCERCLQSKKNERPGYTPCYTNQYKPFFGLSDGKEK